MELSVKKFDELDIYELYEILHLRAEVFVVEQDCPYQDLDGKDFEATHMFLKEDGEIAAVLRILPENVSFDDPAIGRLIVKKKYRHCGIAEMMMKRAIEYVTVSMASDRIRLSGQAYLVDFYTRLGFKKVSEVYLEDGIEHFEFLYEKTY